MEWQSLHGHEGNKNWASPALVAKSTKANRQDQGNTILANEYLDQKQILVQKMEKVAELIRKSKCVVIYSGAGLSKASGIPDYATKAENSIVNFPKIKSSLDALPTYSHFILTRLYEAGYIHYWVQQNHDGLPQKAGFPQEKINEIHGAWFDPSNPVVQFSGSLRGDLFRDMLEIEEKADLCLCLGTSLSGMNADRIARTPAKKYVQDGTTQGTVIINLQQTRLDKHTSVRVWAKLDDAFQLLAQNLGVSDALPLSPLSVPSFGNQMVFEVPYDRTGKYNPDVRMKWDLQVGSPIVIAAPGAMNEGCTGNVYRRSKENNNWSVSVKENKNSNALTYYAFGWWWIEAALKGAIPQLPLINPNPVIVNNVPNPPPKKISYSVAVGNTHSITNVDGNNHRWTCYVKSLQDLQSQGEVNSVIKSVSFKLHPTFSPSTVVVNSYPFEVSRLGWGTFLIRITVTFIDDYVQSFEHPLSFDRDDNQIIYEHP